MITLADQYYLKALDEYPYNLEDSIENLNYALSYDDEHTGANYLMGKLYFEQFQNQRVAEDYYIKVLQIDMLHIPACLDYTYLLIVKGKFKEALRMIQFSYSIEGITLSKVYQLEALVYENKGDFSRAADLIKIAINRSFDNEYIYFLKDELARVLEKMDNSKWFKYSCV